jgi:L-iditol 2-dehydrogenase
LCPEVRFAGHGGIDGALRELMTWPSDALVPIPDSMTMAEAALIEPLSVAMHAVDLGPVAQGSDVGVFGCGPIGLIIIQLCLLAGARTVVATEPLPHRAAAALRHGAHVISGHGFDLTAEIEEATEGHGLDVVFEAAGAQESVDAAVSAARRGGRVIVVGIPSDDRITLKASEARRKELGIILSRRSKPLSERAIGLVRSASVDVLSLVDARHSILDWEAAFGTLVARSAIKVMINPVDGGGEL